jgi:phenylalanyl-tRNA synthetase beta chain
MLGLALASDRDLADMRELIPGLVAAAQKNADRGFADVALFEVGQIFKGDKPEEQFTAATGVRRALAKASGGGRHWSAKAAEVDCFDAKGDAYAALAAAGAPMQALQVVPGAPAWFHPGRSGTIQIGPQNVLGHFGELHPRTLEALDAEGPLVLEVILGASPAEGQGHARQACAELRCSSRSARLRVVVTRDVKAGDLVRAQNVDRKLSPA